MKYFLVALTFLFTLSAYARGIVRIDIDGVINTGSAQYIARAVQHAQDKEAEFLAIRLNTPGGLLNSTREIVQAINTSKVPVGVYIGPGGASATSAGTIIAMSAHVAAMAPGTNIGAAHPVSGQGEDIKGDMNEKAVNDTVAFIRAQAQLRKRNADWAEQAIRKSVSLPAEEAVQKNVVDFIAEDFDQFLMKAGEKKIPVGGVVEVLQMTTGEKVLHFIGDPNVSYILMVLGGLGLYVEMNSPGLIFPGVIGAICLLLSLISFSTLPVNTGAIALLVLALILFIMEVFITSYGLLAIAGIVSMILGGLFLMDPSTGDLRLSLAFLIPVVLGFGAIMTFVGYMFSQEKKKAYEGLAGLEGLVGEVTALGRSEAHANADGKILVHGETWDFRWASRPAETAVIGSRVRIVGRDQFLLIVEKIVP